MGTLLTVLIIAMFSNIQNFHTHEDSSKKQVATLTQEVEKFKERVVEDRSKVQGLESKIQALTDTVLDLKGAVQSLERKMEAARVEDNKRFATLTQNLIEVIKAQ